MSVEISPLPQTEALSQSTLSSAEKRFAQQAGRVITDTIFYGKNVKGTLQETAHKLNPFSCWVTAFGWKVHDHRIEGFPKGYAFKWGDARRYNKKVCGQKVLFFEENAACIGETYGHSHAACTREEIGIVKTTQEPQAAE